MEVLSVVRPACTTFLIVSISKGSSSKIALASVSSVNTGFSISPNYNPSIIYRIFPTRFSTYPKIPCECHRDSICIYYEIIRCFNSSISLSLAIAILAHLLIFASASALIEFTMDMVFDLVFASSLESAEFFSFKRFILFLRVELVLF